MVIDHHPQFDVFELHFQPLNEAPITVAELRAEIRPRTVGIYPVVGVLDYTHILDTTSVWFPFCWTTFDP